MAQKYTGIIEENSSSIKVRLTFEHSILGTAPSDKEVYERFIASNAPDAPSLADEIETLGLDEVTSKGMTIFHKGDDGRAILYDYQIKGFLKSATEAYRKITGSECSKIKSYKKRIDLGVDVTPRHIPITGDYEIGSLQRPLRAQTMQGERVSLACSEEIPAGTQITFTIHCLYGKADIPWIKECLSFGTLNGLGQWRNSGHGKFTFEILDDDGNVLEYNEMPHPTT